MTVLSMRIPRDHCPQASGSPRDFAAFPRIPAELRVMVWEFASHEQVYLHVVQWKNKKMFHPNNHRSYNEFLDPCEYFPYIKKRFSPLMLVTREAHAVATSVKLDYFLAKLPPYGVYQVSSTVSYSNDMFYFPNATHLDELLSAIIGESFANKLERVAVPVFGTPYLNDDYVSGQQFEDAIKGLPKLRRLFLVVDKLFSASFGPRRVARRHLPYQRCPDHVVSRTALREHVRNQHDYGFGFSSYRNFTQRWQMPITGWTGWPQGVEVSFEDYNAYCHRVVDWVLQIADKLGRYIDVRLRVDLDGMCWNGSYYRSGVNFADYEIGHWYRNMAG